MVLILPFFPHFSYMIYYDFWNLGTIFGGNLIRFEVSDSDVDKSKFVELLLILGNRVFLY